MMTHHLEYFWLEVNRNYRSEVDPTSRDLFFPYQEVSRDSWY